MRHFDRLDDTSGFWNTASADQFDMRADQSGRLRAVERIAEIASPRLRTGSASVDLGCGTGLLAECAQDRSIIGVDFSETLVNAARRRMHTVILGNALEPPLDAGSFDNVFSLFVLDDYPDETKSVFFRIVLALLKPEGRFFFGAYSPEDERMGALCSSINAGLNQKFAVYLRECAFYRNELAAVGFTVERDELYRCPGLYKTPTGDVEVQREFILIAVRLPSVAY